MFRGNVCVEFGYSSRPPFSGIQLRSERALLHSLARQKEIDTPLASNQIDSCDDSPRRYY